MRRSNSKQGSDKLGREIQFRPQKRKFYIFCEGKNTEPAYLDHFRSTYAKSPVEIVYCLCGADPIALTRAAVEKKAALISGDKDSQDMIWVVFDRDDHEHYYDAITLAENENLSIAKSNPCFELWIALHIQYSDSSNGREFWQRLCERECPGYDSNRGKIPDLDFLIVRAFDAEINAERLRAAREFDRSTSPYTTVDQLTKCIRGAKRIDARLFKVAAISDEILLEPTAHTTSILIDDNGLLSPHCLKQCISFVEVRRPSLGDGAARKISRQIDRLSSNYAVYLAPFDVAPEKTYSLKDFDNLECLLFFST